MRRSSKTPSDYLIDLPPVLKFNFESYSVITKEYERVRSGKPMVSLDTSRYRLDVPSQKNEIAWKQALQKSQCSLQHQVIRLENLDLMSKYRVDVWKQHNQRLEAILSRMQAQAAELNELIETVNRERKYHQQNVAHVLNDSSKQWKELCEMNIAIEAACVQIKNYLESLKAEAKERGWSLES